MQEYIDKIKDPEIKRNVSNAFKKLPNYFHTMPASSTGKYHPKFSLGKGGLVRHTKCALDIALSLFVITNSLEEKDRDIIIGSLILHDGIKYGLNGSKYTVKKHDDIMADWLEKFWIDCTFEGKGKIMSCIRSHMGQWATTLKPKTKLQRFVHFCDYLASKKFFDKYYD